MQNLDFTYPARRWVGTYGKDKIDEKSNLIPYKKQTNLVYLSYLADLRKKKKKRVRKLL